MRISDWSSDVCSSDLPEVNVGLLPGSGGTQRLLRIAGVKTASDLLLSGRSVRPDEALKLEIVHDVVPAAELMYRARACLSTNPDPVKPLFVNVPFPPLTLFLTFPLDSAAYIICACLFSCKPCFNFPSPLSL